MPSRRFHVGEDVILRPSVNRNIPGGVYEVTRKLPENGGEFEYRTRTNRMSGSRVKAI